MNSLSPAKYKKPSGLESFLDSFENEENHPKRQKNTNTEYEKRSSEQSQNLKDAYKEIIENRM